MRVEGGEEGAGRRVKKRTNCERKKKNYNACKPDSVVLQEQHRLSFIWDNVRTLPRAANPHTSDKRSSSVCLFGISARKVYPQCQLPGKAVVSYTTFSPLPSSPRGRCRRLFSVALSVTCC